MKAAIFDTFGGPLTVRDVAEPACPEDGVVVRVEACGVCRSDWHAWKGTDPDVVAPHVPGHEFAGVVDTVGPHCSRFAPGARVTAPFILACGECADCVGGDPTVCATQQVLGFSAWGAFAERVAVPRADFNLVVLPPTLEAVAAAAMGCRLTTAFRALVDRARLQPGEWLAIHGCGGVGLSGVALGAALGARVLAVDVNAAALDLARSLGATETLNIDTADDAGEAVRALTGGGAHVSLDGLGITATFRNSIYGLRPLGRHVQIGLPLGPHAEPSLPLQELVYARQISIMGTRGIAASRLPALLAMIEAGRLAPGALVTRTIGLEQSGAALADMDGFGQAGITVINRF